MLLFTAPLKNAALQTATRFAMHRNGKKHRFAPLNSGFSLKKRVKTPRGIAAVRAALGGKGFRTKDDI